MADSRLWVQDKLTNPEQIREMIDEPHEAVAKKSITTIDSHVRKFLELSSMFFLATSDTSSHTDVSPRGDKPGFVKVLDERTLAFPDRPGNRRADSLLNIIDNPKVGMLFIIPGMDEVLRVNGSAFITRNEEFIAGINWNGKTTGLAVIVEVEQCFIHCPRALKQAGLWNAEAWIPKEEQPSALEMFKAHTLINGYSEKG